MIKTDNLQRPTIYLNISQAFLRLGDDDLARITCERGIKQFPSDASLHVQRGIALIKSYNRGRKKEDIIQATRSFEKSIAIDPDNYLVLMLSAKIYLKIKGRI